MVMSKIISNHKSLYTNLKISIKMNQNKNLNNNKSLKKSNIRLSVSNIVIIAAAIQLGIDFIPPAGNTIVGLIYIFLGIALVGAGSSLYITCGLGPGPRDGLMTALHHKTGIRVGRVRLAIEGTVLLLGALLGGTLGVGTALFALLIGQSIAIFLGIVARLTSNTSQ